MPADEQDLTSAERFLRTFHNRAPSATSRSLGWGRLPDGRSSYQLVAAAVSAEESLPRILDLACGDGYLVNALRERVSDCDYLGIDISEADLRIAQEAYGDASTRFERRRVQDRATPASSFDFALCHMALMLFDELDDVVSNINRLLASKGTFRAVIGSPTLPEDHDAFAIYVRLIRETVADGTSPIQLGDQRLRTEAGIRKLFSRDAGFESVEVTDDWLVLDSDLENVWSTLALTYPLAQLQTSERAILESRFRAEVARLQPNRESIACRFGLWTITARCAV